MKSFYKQKTFWTGVTAVIGGAAGYLAGAMGAVEAVQTAGAGLAVIFLRQGVEKNK